MNVGATRTLAHSWLLLIHQLPAKPAYLRVKVWRRLQDLGAIAVKNAVHALPMNEETQEDFEWLLREIQEGGGEAFLCEARDLGVAGFFAAVAAGFCLYAAILVHAVSGVKTPNAALATTS